jgi:predicted AlkP superfamily phosphohydrolase/phosphomutase
MWQGLQQIDFSQTKAYHFPMKCPPLAGINLNVRGRQTQGMVAPEEYEALRDAIIRDIQNLRDPKTGEGVVHHVYKREELYHGDFVERAPDIIVWCHDMYKEGRWRRDHWWARYRTTNWSRFQAPTTKREY